MRILLTAGGWSSEREVALCGAASIERSLVELGHEVRRFDPAAGLGDFLVQAKAAQFVFINMHGAPGEDGLLQALLDAAGVPYNGSGPGASFLALNKAAAKLLFLDHDLCTPRFDFLPMRPIGAYSPSFGFPVFVKANLGGSSLDMGLAKSQNELQTLLGGLHGKGLEALVEEAVSGEELSCAVLGDAALPPILIKPRRDSCFFDYAAKYETGGADEICPAPIAPELDARIRRAALAAHRALGCAGVSRADFIHRSGELFLLEVNTLPGMTPTSLTPKAAAAAGLDFTALVARLVELGLSRAGRG